MATSSRMLTLLSLLQVRRDWPAQLLAERLNISDRTVRRDVDRLRELGYRIRAIKGPDGGYRLDAGSELPPLLFDDDQAVALAVALQTVGLAGTGFEEPAARALATVRQVMPARLRHRIDALRVTAVPESRAADEQPVATDVLVALGSAVRAREVLRFDYGSDHPESEGTLRPPRRVEPHHLVTRSGRWYLVAWDLDREDWRTYRADRITPRTHAGPTFEPRPLPGGDVRTFVAGRFKGSDGADVWPCTGEVILDLRARDVVPYVGDGVMEELADARCRVFLGAWSWAGLAASLGRFDADVEVVGPPELAEAFTALGRRFAAAGASAE
jgi:predicted DNA-binding transcriptional regulator YafY